jgi:2'-5' RNA ligase
MNSIIGPVSLIAYILYLSFSISGVVVNAARSNEHSRESIRRMMLRSFIAVKIPREIQNAVARSIAPLQKILPKHVIRWVPAENVHLTLKFLGDVSSANLDHLADSLKTETRKHEIFSMTAGGLGAFPNARRARVLWIGLDDPPALKALLSGIEAVAASLGYDAEDRPFSSHLTIGRVGQNASAADLNRIYIALGEVKIGTLGIVPVDSVHIFKSDLQPAGPIYTALYNLPLNSSLAQPDP